MNGIKNLLELVYNEWATIAAIAALIFAIFSKAKKTYEDWKSKTEEEKEAILKAAESKAISEAKAALSNYILVLVSQAELEWNDKGSKIGAVKRADVIRKIYEQYPALLAVADQEELLAYIDELINKALETVRKTIRVEAAE